MSSFFSRILTVLTLGIGACTAPMDSGTGPPLVVVTIHPVADLVARIGGGDVRVRTLLPPRASLHTWEATPSQIRELSRAAGYITVGGGLDAWLDDLGGDRPGLRRLALTQGMALRAEDPQHGGGHVGSGDPHVWLDPVLVRDVLLPRITDFLQGVEPAASTRFQARAAAVADSLTALDDEIRSILSASTGRAFVATHDAWAYFAARYGLHPLGSLYASPAHEPGARGLASLVDAARSARVGAVLAEPQLAENAARALAGELDVSVLEVDPLGGAGVAGRDSYFDLMRFNARAFARALGPS